MKRILLLGIFLYFLGAVGIAHNPTRKNSLKQEDKVQLGKGLELKITNLMNKQKEVYKDFLTLSSEDQKKNLSSLIPLMDSVLNDQALVEIRSMRARTFAQLGEYQKAILDVKILQRIKPKEHIYHVFEAALLYKQGKKVEAQEQVKIALSLIGQTYSETPNVNNGLELVFIYALLDKKEKARDVLSRIKPINDDERIQIEYIRKALEKDQLTMEHSFGEGYMF